MKSFLIRQGVLQEKKEELRVSRVGNPNTYQKWLRFLAGENDSSDSSMRFSPLHKHLL